MTDEEALNIVRAVVRRGTYVWNREEEDEVYTDLKVFYDVTTPLLEMEGSVLVLSLEPERALRRMLGPSLVLSTFVYDFEEAIREIELYFFESL